MCYVMCFTVILLVKEAKEATGEIRRSSLLSRGENACKQWHYRVLKKLKLKAQEVDLWTEVPKDEH
jgi:hypothetical protein